jgi:hypothetical protein
MLFRPKDLFGKPSNLNLVNSNQGNNIDNFRALMRKVEGGDSP